MKRFLIQIGSDKQVLHDFGFQTKEAVAFANWYHNDQVYDLDYCQDVSFSKEGYIPVGSVEFVLGYYAKHFGINEIKPIYMPPVLKAERFLKRQLFHSDEILEIDSHKEYFIKETNVFKGEKDIVKGFELLKRCAAGKSYHVSEVVDFISEWRCFVYNGQLLDVRCYGGDPWLLPDKDLVHEMVAKYQDGPRAYTLDIGVLNNGVFETIIVEVHPFFSCGLYGFSDHSKLLLMYEAAYYDILNNKGLF